eukprot:5915957-Prymnesium_polylepis.1
MVSAAPLPNTPPSASQIRSHRLDVHVLNERRLRRGQARLAIHGLHVQKLDRWKALPRRQHDGL